MLITKEIKSLFRQSRSTWLLLMAFFIPFALFFMLFRFSGQIIQSQIDSSTTKKYKVAWIAEDGQAEEIKRKLKLNLQIEIKENIGEDEMIEAIENDSLSAGIIIGENFDSAIAKKEKAEITFYFKGSNRAVNIVEKTLAGYRKEIVKQNLKDSGLPEAMLNPIDVNEQDLSSMQDMIDNLSELLDRTISSLLSILLLILGAVGARHALNTVFWREAHQGYKLLYSQSVVSSTRIFLSKIGLASLFSFSMMGLSVLGFAAALSMDQTGIIQGIMLQIRTLLNWTSLSYILLCSVPMAFIFSGFWGIIGFNFHRSLSVLLANIAFMLLLIIFVLLGSSSQMLNASNMFYPFLSLVFSIKSIMSADFNLLLLLKAFVPMLVWVIFFNVLNLWRFRKSIKNG
jgi:hypothetical protein